MLCNLNQHVVLLPIVTWDCADIASNWPAHGPLSPRTRASLFSEHCALSCTASRRGSRQTVWRLQCNQLTRMPNAVLNSDLYNARHITRLYLRCSSTATENGFQIARDVPNTTLSLAHAHRIVRNTQHWKQTDKSPVSRAVSHYPPTQNLDETFAVRTHTHTHTHTPPIVGLHVDLANKTKSPTGTNVWFFFVQVVRCQNVRNLWEGEFRKKFFSISH